ncbi:MAG: 4-hydroxy-3-methylbut-2-enyl diphosphate reductase, partial [Candidatus Omnitrophica bacterium]|nr:4-hydroxy-3-methylbut-2-enyl diphosphate reductase [Candidatus Omnitrophota bacterium]
MIVRKAKQSGFCFGVHRAVRLAEQTLQKNNRKNVYCLGPLIHNNQEIERLEKQGLKLVDSLKGLKKGYLIIRSHGISPRVMKQIDRSCLKIVDATCPRVRKAQQIAGNLRNQKYKIIIIGNQAHPEVKGLKDFAGSGTIVLNSKTKAEKIKTTVKDKIGLLAQTTQEPGLFKDISIIFLKKNYAELTIYNTICEASVARQKSTVLLADKVDTMVILGGKTSANTKRLVTLCRRQGVKTFHVEEPSRMRSSWFKGAAVTGVSAGASTPDWIIK